MIDRRRLLLAGAASAVAASWPVFAQKARVPRIGYLVLSPLSDTPSRERQAFLDALRELGYVAGKTIEIVYASAQNEQDFVDDVCRDLLGRKPDLIVVSGAIATLAAKKATASVPIVFMALGDPVGIGAVRSLARPGGNVTGVSFISSELAGKRVQLVKEMVPAAKRVAVLWDSRNANARAESDAALAAAASLQLKAEPIVLASDADLPRALNRLQANKPDLLYVAFEGGIVASNRTLIAEFGVRHRVPVVSGWSNLTEAGGLISYAPDIPAMFRRSASYVDRILRGAKPAALPVEQATTVELVVNARTAKALGIAIPREILLRADRVIQ